MENEIWKDVKGFEGFYQVSSNGNVRSLDRHVQRGNSLQFVKGKILKPVPNVKSGYLTVGFKNGLASKRLYVHRLVAALFLENPENKPQVNHLDGDKSNCHFNNLEWATSLENHEHAWANGLINNSGENQGASKLNTSDVLAIRLALRNGESQRKLAAKFGVAQITISEINTQKTWSHL